MAIQKSENNDLVHCQACSGSYARKYFYCHKRKCSERSTSETSPLSVNLVNNPDFKSDDFLHMGHSICVVRDIHTAFSCFVSRNSGELNLKHML